METFQEAAPMTKLLNLKTRDQMEVDNFSEFNDPLGISDSAPVEETFQDFVDKSQDNLGDKNVIRTQDDTDKDNHDSSFESSTQSIEYKTCDICNLQYNSMQFEFHTSTCKKYFHHFVRMYVDSDMFQCKICQQNFRRTGLLYKHLEKSHDRIITEILLDKQMQDDFGEDETQNNLNDDDETTDEMIQNMEEKSQNNFEDMADNKDQLSSIPDEISIPKIGYKTCNICSLQYSIGEQFKNHSAQCKKYFHHFVEINVDSNLYQCKICQQNYRRTGLLYKHLEKSHERIITEIILNKQMQDDFGEDEAQNNLNDDDTSDEMIQNMEEEFQNNFEDAVDDKDQLSSIQDENSIPKIGYKRCNICCLQYSMGEQFKNHSAQCETYFHMVEVDTEMNIYKCKFCRSLFR